MRTGLWVVVMAMAMSGCYRPEVDRCSVTCTDFCPGAQSCEADGYCHAAGDSVPCSGPPPVKIAKLTAGRHHACAIDKHGRLLCWGANQKYQVGVGLDDRRFPTATPFGEGTGWSVVDAGEEHTCGIHGSTLLCWGNDEERESGGPGGPDNKVVKTPTSPTWAQVPLHLGWTTVSAGNRFSCGIHEQHLYCWGHDGEGQLGDGDTTGPAPRPADETDEGPVTDWDTVSAGTSHACAINMDGELYCWGRNDEGQLGDDTGIDQQRPTRVPLPEGETVQPRYATVSAGTNVSCAVTDDGSLYCWGTPGPQRGVGDAATSAVPRRVIMPATGWMAVDVGALSACARRADGVWCWGNSEAGGIGDGFWRDRSTPAAVVGIGTQPSHVAVGGDFACAAPAAGGIMCWGDNPEGELGNNETSTKHVPTPVGETDGAWTAIAAGRFHTCGVYEQDVWCWGWNEKGNLDGTIGEDTATPTKVRETGAGAMTSAIGVGEDSTCAIINDELWCWGEDGHGQLGNGAPTGRQPPRQIGTLAGWSGLTVSGFNASALRGGIRYVWGEGTGYGLGNNAVANVTQPTNFDAVTWKAIGLGNQFGCGLEQGSNALYCWGDDTEQKQGNGPGQTEERAPHLVPGTDFEALGVAWSGDHACAITTEMPEMEGKLFCWGRNDNSQAGPGASPIGSPTDTEYDTGWTSVAAGQGHTCGIKSGDLYCWGDHGEGQLGEDIAEHLATVPLQPRGAWTAVSAGFAHTCGIRQGDLYCWGANVHGQIGDGTHAWNVPGWVSLPAP